MKLAHDPPLLVYVSDGLPQKVPEWPPFSRVRPRKKGCPKWSPEGSNEIIPSGKRNGKRIALNGVETKSVCSRFLQGLPNTRRRQLYAKRWKNVEKRRKSLKTSQSAPRWGRKTSNNTENRQKTAKHIAETSNILRNHRKTSQKHPITLQKHGYKRRKTTEKRETPKLIENTSQTRRKPSKIDETRRLNAKYYLKCALEVAMIESSQLNSGKVGSTKLRACICKGPH